jgi:hypothetical protein
VDGPISTVFEPFAGAANASFYCHFLRPQLNYIQIDLDEQAKWYSNGRNWIKNASHDYRIGNVLDSSLWKTADPESSISYVGAQSFCYLSPKDLLKFFSIALTHTRCLILDCFDRRHSKSTIDETSLGARLHGFRTYFKVERANLYQGRSLFHLEASKNDECRMLFTYDWYDYLPSHLLNILSLHDDLKIKATVVGSDFSSAVPVEGIANFKLLGQSYLVIEKLS